MAANDYYLGEGSLFGFALNTVASGFSWGGAPGPYVWMRPVGGNMSMRYGNDQNVDPTNEVHPTQVSQGPLVCSGTVQLFLSYANYEELLMMISGGADAIAGVGPYTHTIALDNTVMYGSFAGWWVDVKGITTQITVTDAAISQMTITHAFGSRPILTIAWSGKDYAATAPVAPSITAYDLVRWDDLVLTLNAVARCVNGYTLDLIPALRTDDFGSDGKLCSLLRTGQFLKTLTLDVGMDSTFEAFLQAPGTAITGTNTIVYNNGAAGAARREFQVTLGDLYPEPLDTQIANIGKRQESLAFGVIDSAPFEFKTTNGRDAAAAQPV